MLRNFVLLTLGFIVIFALCMQIDGGVEKLPESQGYEATHNTSDGAAKSLPEHSPATLDEEFIGRYIDVNHFDSASTTTTNGYNSTSSNFNTVNGTAKSEYNSNKNTVEQKEKSFPSDLNDKINEMEKDKSEDEEEINNFIDDYKEDTNED